MQCVDFAAKSSSSDFSKRSLPVATVAPVHTLVAPSDITCVCSAPPYLTNQFGLDSWQLKEHNWKQSTLFQKYCCKMTDMDVPPAGGYQFPMVRYTDMEEDMKKDVSLRNIWFGKDSMLKVLSWKRMWNLTELQVMEICNSACDNHAANNELCAKNIKVQKHNHTTKSNWSKFPGSSWQEVWPKLARYCGRGIWIWDQLRDQENVLHVFCRQGIKTHKYLPILNDNFLIN